jgi:signal transduction histidine kinase
LGSESNPPGAASSELVTFLEDTASASATVPSSPPWKVLIADDDEAVHSVTKLALERFQFLGRTLEFLDAFSAREAKQILAREPRVAVALVDVVMERPDAGLELVRYIREERKDPFLRIVLRTGQPGEAPEREVITSYEINDYKTKTELTAEKLYAVLLASLRSFDALLRADDYAHNLERKVDERTHELDRRNAELEALNRTKDKFFSIVAHDLNNPLAVLLGFSDILVSRRETLSPNELDELLTGVRRSAETLSRLLANLLEWARGQLGRRENTPIVMNLKEHLSATLEVVGPQARAKDIALEVQVDEAAVAFADPDAIRTVLRNLITNAVKFTPRGGRIRISCARRCAQVELLVSDTGIGISEEERRDLFRLDRRSGASNMGTNQERGTGLGLVLSKELVEANRGRLEVESALGRGSTFRCLLPIAAPSAHLQKVLAIDDDPYMLRLIQIGLEVGGRERGFRVMTAAGGSEGIERARADRPDVVLLDVTMPQLDGLETLARLKQDDALRSIPVVMLSGEVGCEAFERAQSLGAIGHIQKPFDPRTLATQVCGLLAAVDEHR